MILPELAVLVGITLSFHYEATAGGTIVLVAVAIYRRNRPSASGSYGRLRLP